MTVWVPKQRLATAAWETPRRKGRRWHYNDALFDHDSGTFSHFYLFGDFSFYNLYLLKTLRARKCREWNVHTWIVPTPDSARALRARLFADRNVHTWIVSCLQGY